MKRYAFTFFAIICTLCLYSQQINKSEYKILRIKKRASVFVIYAQRNDSIFKIVSEDPGYISNSSKIRKGRYYNLDLVRIFPHDSIIGIPMMPTLTIKGITMEDGSVIGVEKESHYSLYESKRLKGVNLSNE
jgi:hypothetical protein